MPTTFTTIKDAPARVTLPQNAPDWMRDYVKQVEAWTREVASAVRQLQQKVGELEK